MKPHFIITLGDIIGGVCLLGFAFLFLGTHAFEAVDTWRERRAKQRQLRREAKRQREWP